ncbi:hypothetical protein [uncultured Friedmanniella sp.]|uniref:hypothetical protein n=1 Tax=uncultured Friedmanniella sp. TaxID=335381 RepID=UPI0035C9EE3B
MFASVRGLAVRTLRDRAVGRRLLTGLLRDRWQAVRVRLAGLREAVGVRRTGLAVRRPRLRTLRLLAFGGRSARLVGVAHVVLLGD